MSSNIDKKEAFFPGVRKPVMVRDIKPLANAAGEKRIKVSLEIDLSDNQLVGIPEWLEDAINLVRRADGGSQKNESVIELDGCILRFFSIADHDVCDLEVTGVLLKKFVVVRTSKESTAGDLADSALHFSLYCAWLDGRWDSFGRMFDRKVFVNFGTTQAKLFVGPPKKDGTPKPPSNQSALFTGKDAAAGEKPEGERLVIDETNADQVFTTQEGETDEDARLRATDPKHDALFTGPTAAQDEAAAGSGKGRRGPRLVGGTKASAVKPPPAAKRSTSSTGKRVN